MLEFLLDLVFLKTGILDVLKNWLNKETLEDVAAVKTRYNRNDSIKGKRKRLEEEHHRRMMGLYQHSARKKEEDRHAKAVEEMFYEEEITALRERSWFEKFCRKFRKKGNLGPGE